MELTRVTVPVTLSDVPTGVTVASWPTFSLPSCSTGTVAVTSAAPSPTTTTTAVPAETWSPTAEATDATVPEMGDVSVAPARDCCASTSFTFAWSTAACASATELADESPDGPDRDESDDDSDSDCA